MIEMYVLKTLAIVITVLNLKQLLRIRKDVKNNER